MFYFEEDEALANERQRVDSVSSRASSVSVGSDESPTDSGVATTLTEPSTLTEPIKLPTPPLAVSVPLPMKMSVDADKGSPSSMGRSPGSRKKKGLVASPGSRRTRTRRADTLTKTTFNELYEMSPSVLGRGAYAQVRCCRSRITDEVFAVKIIDKNEGHSRSRVIKEIETFDMCKGHPNIVQLIEFFEEDGKFFIIFEMMSGGPLLNHIQRRIYFTEREAAMVTRDLANALAFLHDRGIAHRDVKPENVLCSSPDFVSPVKLCDLDLASKADTLTLAQSINKTPELRSPVGSAEFLAPEVVDTFVGEALRYDKRCDMWSLGVIVYIMLCGYPPFYGECNRPSCAWNDGEHCSDCQAMLFQRIRRGEYDFPEEDWYRVSDQAKDLIAHLLVKDAKKRLTPHDVLAHPWLNTDNTPKTPLQTPDVLLRKDSARDLHQINQNFHAADRLGVVADSTSIMNAVAGSRVPGGNRSAVPSLSRLVLRKSANAQLPGPCNGFSALSQRPSDEGVAVRS